MTRSRAVADDPAATPARPGRVRMLVLLGGITGIGPFTVDAYLPAFPAIADGLDATPSQVQLTLAAYLLAVAVGQLVVGTLSDGWGRRRPVLVGLAAYVVVSVACALAPSIELLVVLRVLQGLAGGAAVVVARAVVRDLYTGADATRFFSHLTLVFGVAPIVAPSVGGLVLLATGWRGIFAGLSVLGALLLTAAALALPETLPPARRRSPRFGPVLRTMAGLLRDRPFLGLALAQGFGFAGMFSYIAGSPFVVQEVYGATATVYGLLFGLNALGFVLAGQVSAALAGRVPERTTLRAALLIGVAAGAALVTTAATGAGGLVALAAALFAFVSSLGLVLPCATSLALARHPDAAGTAAALMGFGQTLIGALAAPLVGLGPAGSAVPMAVAVAGCATAALAALLTLARRA